MTFEKNFEVAILRGSSKPDEDWLRCRHRWRSPSNPAMDHILGPFCHRRLRDRLDLTLSMSTSYFRFDFDH